MKSSLQALLPLVQTRWRQGRRLFDGRLLNERRLIIVAMLALTWFALDAVFITPGFKAFREAATRDKASTAARDAMQAESEHHKADMMLKEVEAQQEVQRIRERIEHSKQALAQQQAMLAPARDMRNLLEGLLAQNGALRLRAVRTLPPEEVKFTPMPGVDISQTLLYKQSMVVSVDGSFMELLTWLRSLEALPRKLLWDGLVLQSQDAGRLTLTLTVHTYSPDRDALEISP
jgi:MSHA biogenesis protein MshJ